MNTQTTQPAAYFLAEFEADDAGQLRQGKTLRLTPAHIETITEALRFQYCYLTDTADEITETAGEEHAAGFLAAARRTRDALRALDIDADEIQTDPRAMEETPDEIKARERYQKTAAAVRAGLDMVSKWGILAVAGGAAIYALTHL